MTLATFTPPRNPDAGMTDKPESKILSAGFGDGYTQETADGINHIRSVVNLTWSNLTQAEYQAMLAFWKQQGGGTTPFLYTLPEDASPTMWTWKDITKTSSFTDASGYIRYAITGTFRQSFNITS